MEIPQALHLALDNEIKEIKRETMINDAQSISIRYRTQSGKGERLLTKDSEAVAYAASRMPATFGAVSFALEQSLKNSKCCIKSLLDVGAGTGAVTWAVDQQINLESITCLERENAMRKIGKSMMQYGGDNLKNAKWISHDLIKDKISQSGDLVVASYVLNEMTNENRIKVSKELWNATNKMLLIIEPGTPVGFENLMNVRKELIECGAKIVAPCVHMGDCEKKLDDWCHFSCRVGRTKLHKDLKGGEVPYEDEKFIYMAFTKEEYELPKGRVLRHPQVRKGHIILEVCTNEGIKEVKLSKKDGLVYKKARKIKTGEEIEY